MSNVLRSDHKETLYFSMAKADKAWSAIPCSSARSLEQRITLGRGVSLANKIPVLNYFPCGGNQYGKPEIDAE